MTNPDSIVPIRFALLTNGSSFSRAVLVNLRSQDFLPDLLVLPEYPPKRTTGSILEVSPVEEISKLVSGIDIAYAPREWQSRCAEDIRQRGIDFILVACWPYLIATELRTSPRQAALNLHPSALPRYRGADPIEQQIAAGDLLAGVSLHLLSAEFDRGDIVAQHTFEVDRSDLDASYLESRCAEAGVDIFVAAMRGGQESWRPVQQTVQALETD